ncbi:unnamed protein product [Cyprideis torosa]|uniref:Uncharacterized protein n=1 Tax=Cyprideis torosa TaxID=163714 RepID=A0A7R8ZZ31_9CRUS|nr:unnamed protein product [Cyprideis torosa]CAG0909339.1 unnamed protein product [Cyprideis torosa]
MSKQNHRQVRAAEVFSHPIHFLAFGFGSGLAPKAPGTFGTLAAIPLYWALSHYNVGTYLLVTLLVSVVGIWICGESSRLLGVHDHGGIVWDEFAGLLVTLIALPAGIGWLVLGFVLFRFFDIVKPWPIGWLDARIPGGAGIMVDDLVAGLYGLVIIQVLARIV